LSWADFQKLLATFGAPGALMLTTFYALHKTWLRLGREYTEQKAAWERDREELVTRYEEMKTEKNMWRDLAVKNAFTVERATDIAHTAMNARGPDNSMQGKD
jgi:hypothetical protein